MAKHLASIIAVASLLALLVASCGPTGTAPKQSAIKLTDQLGRVVELDKVPQRIVSLAPSNTEILFALGLGDKVVGDTTYCDYPPEAMNKPKIGGFSTPDIEKIVALNPDLVVAAPIHEKEVIPQLESRGLKVLALAPKTVDDVLKAIDLTGDATGTRPAADKLVADMQSRIDRVKAVVNALSSDPPRVFYVVWHDPLMTTGSDTLQGQLIEMAGGKNIFGDLSSYPTVDLETLLQRQPQVIIAGVGHGAEQDTPLQWARSESRLKDTEARQQDKVLEIDANMVSRAGPRIVDGLEDMVRAIHPELADKLKN